MGPDDQRFERLYDRHHRSIRAYCGRRLDADKVDDAVADTFLIAWRRVDQIPSGRTELVWLYGVARRVVMHQWRSTLRRRRLDSRLTGLGPESPSQPDAIVVAHQDQVQVLEAAARLKPIDQEILRLSLWEELGHADVATILDLEVAAVRKRLSRARANLTREFNRIEARSQTPAAQKGGAQ